MTNKNFLEQLIDEEKSNQNLPIREVYKRDNNTEDKTLNRLESLYLDELTLIILKKAILGRLIKDDKDNVNIECKLDLNKLNKEELIIFVNNFNFPTLKKEDIKEE